jgi:hypothetical protein
LIGNQPAGVEQLRKTLGNTGVRGAGNHGAGEEKSRGGRFSFGRFAGLGLF